MYYDVTSTIFCATIVAVKRNVLYVMSVCFVAFGIQHAMRVRRLPSVASPALNISHKRHYFKKRAIGHRVISTTNLYEIFLIVRRTERHMIKHEYWSPR
jgi:hypothetical protein